MLIFDAHLDLAMNAIEWNRDLTLPVEKIRPHEAHLRDAPGRGTGTVSLPEMRRAGISYQEMFKKVKGQLARDRKLILR